MKIIVSEFSEYIVRSPPASSRVPPLSICEYLLPLVVKLSVSLISRASVQYLAPKQAPVFFLGGQLLV